MYTVEVTVLIQYLWNFVRMLTNMKSKPWLKLGYVELKTRSLDQILERKKKTTKHLYTLEGTDMIQS